jgi:hypothetical protein
MKQVFCSRKRLFAPAAYHYTIKVQDTWFELAGASKHTKDSRNGVFQKHGCSSELGATETAFLGTTTATWEDIELFLTYWQRKHPNYNLHGDNCQEFGKDFAIFLCGDTVVHRLPLNYHGKWLSITPGIIQAWEALKCIAAVIVVYLMGTLPFIWIVTKIGLLRTLFCVLLPVIALPCLLPIFTMCGCDSEKLVTLWLPCLALVGLLPFLSHWIAVVLSVAVASLVLFKDQRPAAAWLRFLIMGL